MKPCSTLLMRELRRARYRPPNAAKSLTVPRQNPRGRCALKSSTMAYGCTNCFSIPARPAPSAQFRLLLLPHRNSDGKCNTCDNRSPSPHRFPVSPGSLEKICKTRHPRDFGPQGPMDHRASGQCCSLRLTERAARGICHQLPTTSDRRCLSLCQGRVGHTWQRRIWQPESDSSTSPLRPSHPGDEG